MEEKAGAHQAAGVICYSTRVLERLEEDRVVDLSRDDFNGHLQEVSLWQMCARNTFGTILRLQLPMNRLGGVVDAAESGIPSPLDTLRRRRNGSARIGGPTQRPRR